MRHAISPNQLVLWPHHELTDAWKPTGILLSPPPRSTRQAADLDKRPTSGGQTRRGGSRSRRKDRYPSPSTALTDTAGVCSLVKQPSRHSKRPGGRVQPRSGSADLY